MNTRIFKQYFDGAEKQVKSTFGRNQYIPISRAHLIIIVIAVG